MQANLNDKVAVVIGGSYGIGKAIAIKFAENGADLVIVARNPEKAQPVVEQIQGLGRKAIFEKGDATNFQEMQQIVKNALEKFGKIDILVPCGRPRSTKPHLFHDVDTNQYLDYFKEVFLSKAYPIRAVLDHMRERQMGKIVIITTDAGRVPSIAGSMHGGAAAGLLLASKVWAREFSRWKIRINTICTILTVDTEGHDKFKAGTVDDAWKKSLGKMGERAPFGFNTPKDIAEAALFFASEDSNQITGQILSISGGLSFPG